MCHIDGTCIEPGRCDANGVATLALESGLNADEWDLFGADDDFVYGFQNIADGPGRILRWPIDGGAFVQLAEHQVAGGARGFVRYAGVLDARNIYFIGGSDFLGDQANVLLSMPKDGSAEPVKIAAAGNLLGQDDEMLYFTTPDDQELQRASKATPDKLEKIYSPGHRVLAVATNNASIFASGIERVAISGQLRKIDKISLAHTDVDLDMAATWLTANADYCFEGDSMGIYRVDFSGTKPVALPSDTMVSAAMPVGSEVYFSQATPPDKLPMHLSAVDIERGTTRLLFVVTSGDDDWIRSQVVSPHAVFVHSGARLLRVTP